MRGGVVIRAVIPVAVLAACSPFEFETQACFPLDAARDGDNDPPWRSDAGDSGGPRFVSGSVEWLSIGDTACRFDLRFELAVRDGQQPLTATEIADMTVFAPGDFDPSPPYLFVINGDAVFDRDDDGNAKVMATGCAAEIDGLESRQAALFLKLRDADGRESDAFCARTFAKTGADLPARNGENDDGA